MKVKINTHGNALPEVHGEWIDLCTAEDVTLDFLEYKIISLGVSIEIPAGYYAHVVPRSSTFGKWGMQVDHFLPLRAWGIEDAGTNDISNLMPACRMCNHYKRANTLETFRRYIAEIPRKLREDYIYKVGVVYGNIVENEKPIVFFFEKEGETK